MCVFVSLRRSSSQISCVLIRLEPPPLPYTLYNAELYVEVVCFFPSTKCIIVEVDPTSRDPFLSDVWDAEMFLAETFSNWQICVWQKKNPKLKRAEGQRAASVRMWSLLVFRRIQFCFAGFYMREQKSKNAFAFCFFFFSLFHCLLSSRLGFTAFPCTTWCYNRVTAPPLFFFSLGALWAELLGNSGDEEWTAAWDFLHIQWSGRDSLSSPAMLHHACVFVLEMLNAVARLQVSFLREMLQWDPGGERDVGRRPCAAADVSQMSICLFFGKLVKSESIGDGSKWWRGKHWSWSVSTERIKPAFCDVTQGTDILPELAAGGC